MNKAVSDYIVFEVSQRAGIGCVVNKELFVLKQGKGSRKVIF